MAGALGDFLPQALGSFFPQPPRQSRVLREASSTPAVNAALATCEKARAVGSKIWVGRPQIVELLFFQDARKQDAYVWKQPNENLRGAMTRCCSLPGDLKLHKASQLFYAYQAVAGGKELKHPIVLFWLGGMARWPPDIISYHQIGIIRSLLRIHREVCGTDSLRGSSVWSHRFVSQAPCRIVEAS